MKEASVNISELTTLTQEQQEALSKLGDTIQGNLAYQYIALHAQRAYADATHDVSMGLKVLDYVYKEIPTNIQAAVNAVREYTEAQKDNKEATQRMTAAMREHQIQLLELQLKGMMRRRGLTRSEEQAIKKIQIAQAQARLENMVAQKSMLESDVSTNQASKALIDDYLLKLKEKQYELKYTYDQQITDLETTISREGEKLLTRYEWWETTNRKIIASSQNLMITLNEILGEDVFSEKLKSWGLDVGILKEKVIAFMATAGLTYVEPEPVTEPTTPFDMATFTSSLQNYLASLRKPLIDLGIADTYEIPSPWDVLKTPTISIRQRGTEYVHETGLAVIHKGEAISPAGRESPSGDTYIDNVTIEVKELADIDDVGKVASVLGAIRQAQLSNKRGKSKYRLR